MIRSAITCDASPNCEALYLERLPKPGQYNRTHAVHQAAEAGWTVPQGMNSGHVCPACRAGRGPVLERGECPKCAGRTGNTATGDRCHYCRYEIPYPDDDAEDELDVCPGCSECYGPQS